MPDLLLREFKHERRYDTIIGNAVKNMKDSLRLKYLSIKDSIAGPTINAVLRDRCIC
jgi:hypothetical protein